MHDKPDVPQWRIPAPTLSLDLPRTVVELADAVLTPFARGSLGTSGPPRHWHSGAVYDRHGRLVPHSQRIGGIGGEDHVAVDPPFASLGQSTPARPGPHLGAPERLDGSWYYGGTWFAHFGHFLLETLPTLWAHHGEPVIFHSFGRVLVEPHHERLLTLAGVMDLPHFVKGPTQVERLVVPSRQAAVNASFGPGAVGVWRRIAHAVPARKSMRRRTRRLLWLSRTKLSGGGPAGPPRGITNEEALDRLFRRCGFQVVHPQRLSIDEQIRLVREASVLAGVEGSALHLSAFARPGTRVLVLGWARRPYGDFSQPSLDAVLENPQAVIPYRGDDAQAYDLDHVQDRLVPLLAELPRPPSRVPPALGPRAWARS